MSPIFPEPSRHFHLDKGDLARVNEWLGEHDKTCPYAVNQGSIGGRLTYSFTPNSLGTVVRVTCACGETFDATDYNW